VSGIDMAAAAVAGVMGGSVLVGIYWVAPRVRRRREKTWERRAADGARTKGNLDDLMGVAEAAGVPPVPVAEPETCDVPDERPLQPISAEELGEIAREQARPWIEPEAVTGWDPDRRESTGLVRIGSRLIHPQCARARRDGRDEQICEYCRPAFAVGGAS
jgi:hypothetical protein